MVPAFFISMMLTGNPIPQIGFGSELSAEPGVFLLDKLDQLSIELGFNQYTDGTKSKIDVFAITAALMVGTAGLPHVIVRFFTVPKVSDARKSAFWALLFIAILYTTAPAIATFARTNLLQNVPGQEYAKLEENGLGWVKTWEKTKLITFEDKNGDGKIQYYNDKNLDYAAKAEAAGWKGNELTIDRDIMVLANPEIAGLPNWVIALVAAGGLAAALSTAAGLLLVISTSVSRDLLRSSLMPNITEKQELIAARVAAFVAVSIAALLGIYPPGFVAQVVAFAFGLAASSFFPTIILGIFYKRMNKEGAIAGMVVGLVFTAAYIIAYKGVFMDPLIENTPENWLFGISPEGIGTIGMLLNFIVSLSVSHFTPEPPQEVQDLVEEIRIPRGVGSAHDH